MLTRSSPGSFCSRSSASSSTVTSSAPTRGARACHLPTVMGMAVCGWPVTPRTRSGSARHTLVRLAIKTAYRKVIHAEGWNGERSRRRLGREILDLGNLENEADGIRSEEHTSELQSHSD